MKFFLTFCLLLISIPTLASAQPRVKQDPPLTRTQTREAERRLSDLGYWTGAVDGVFDKAAQSALSAFQKWEGRPITGQFTLAELEAIRTSSQLDARKRWPKARDIGYAHVEVDLDRQVLMFVNDEGSVRVLPVSTGNGKPFMDEGQES
ncbi:MAG: peptidoglycan-binding domain-containing protein, partial [bacterium]